MNRLSTLKYIFLFQLLLVIHSAHSQQLILQGKITYERKENLHKQFEDFGNEWTETLLKKIPKYETDLFQLTFNANKTVYKLLKQDENTAAAMTWGKVAWNNSVACDLELQSMLDEKDIYGNLYCVHDSLPPLEWKLTGEYREIAGFNCRRATTIIRDSLYVIAFYTDEIPVSSGPEALTGLPGMILGAVVPRLNYTFFATKVEGMMIPEKDLDFIPAKKAKKVTQLTLLATMKEAMEDWGKYGRKIYWKAAF